MDSARVIAAYQGERGKEYHHRLLSSPQMFDIVALARAAKFQRYVKPDAKVLEYGVGPGYNLAKLLCGSKTGVDVSEFLAQKINALGITFKSNSLELADESFDVIICHHVLEHVAEPWATLTELRRLLAPGGTLLLFVPYDREKQWQKYNSDEKSGHIYSWTPQTLCTLTERAGFEFQETNLQLFGYDRFAAVIAEKFLGGLLTYRLVRRMLLFIRPMYEVRAVFKKSQ